MMTFSNAAEIITSTDIKKKTKKTEKNYSTPAESGVSKDKNWCRTVSVISYSAGQVSFMFSN